MNPRWKIDELAQVVETALETGDYRGQGSGRVKAVPDARTIRYYTTLGLLDKPAEMRGRTAYYGRRHVLQLVAIKRLQAEGRPLVEVQQSLAGADDRSLKRYAALPAEFWERVTEPETSVGKAAEARRATAETAEVTGRQRGGEFWKERPQIEAATHTGSSEVGEFELAPVPALHLQVAPGLRLEVEGVDPGKVQEGAFGDVVAALHALAAALERAGWISGVQSQSPVGEQQESREQAPPGESEEKS